MNARMAFDRETLQPLYHLEVGEAGESCALQIAKRLGMPAGMLTTASNAAYGEVIDNLISEAQSVNQVSDKKQEMIPKIQKKKVQQVAKSLSEVYSIGDSVMIYPDKKIGIVCTKINEKGVLQVQLKDKKIWINHKRVKLHVKSEELYPDDYDFSIIFDSVETRKARHEMDRKYCENIEINI
jgi:dsDNA-specific endonuclease/ATPase MutS2